MKKQFELRNGDWWLIAGPNPIDTSTYYLRKATPEELKDMEGAIKIVNALTGPADGTQLYADIEDHQNEPHLIANTPEEADEIISMWEKGLYV